MRIANFCHAGQDRIGVAISENDLIDLAEALAASTGEEAPGWAHDMLGFIQACPSAMQSARAALEWATAHADKVARIPMAEVKWHAPVRRPTKICCLALNNSANADRIVSGPKHPAIFIKAANALVGHDEGIEVKAHYGRVHPEPELALIIGKRAKNILARDAYDHVFGYTVHNDITSPTMRGEDTFNYRAIHPGKNGSEIEYVDSYVTYPGRYKGSDTFSPMGPWIVTADEIPDPHTLKVTCSHQGRTITEDNTINLSHKVPEVLEFLSGYMTLEPGDIVSMGTAIKASAGGGAVQNIDLQKLGGPVSVSIEKIGTLSSNVVQG
tara:strand:+ start:8068 stop:9042 length:975 start_codon:yes stop_codon:yes gene_type:complete